MSAAESYDLLLPPRVVPLDTILHGDCLEVLRTLPDASVDAIVTDPPYGLGAAPDMVDVLRAWLAGEAYTPRGKGGFMGKTWDKGVPGPEYWRECLRVLKPGGHALVFAGTRTWDVMGLALRLAGFEIRDTLQWLYGSGFPKSLDVGKQLDKAAGATREEVWYDRYHDGMTRNRQDAPRQHIPLADGRNGNVTTIPATDAARAWDGWGTALKPSWEPIIVCRKPLGEGTVAANVIRHGVGALHVDACRVGNDGTVRRAKGGGYDGGWKPLETFGSTAGRWPPNLLLSHSLWCDADACADDCPVAALDAQSGIRLGAHRQRHITSSDARRVY